MLTTETTIETPNASRYLVQLCKHASKMGHGLRRLHARTTHERPDVLDVDWSDTHGMLTLSWGKCTFDASPTTLNVRIDTPDEERLHGLQRIIANDLERFGNREQIKVAWRQVQPDETS